MTIYSPINWSSNHSRQRWVVAGIIILLGAGVLAHPLYLWPHYGQSAFVLNVEGTANNPASAIEYESLPAGAQSAFDEALADGPTVLWSGEDNRAISSFESQPTVHHENAYYETGLIHRDSGDFIDGLVRWLLTATGGFLLVYGGAVLYTVSWRPLTPLRALWVPATVSVAFLTTRVYDVVYSGVDGSVWALPGSTVIGIIPIATLFVVVGTAVACNGWGSRTATVGALCSLLLVTVLVGSLSLGLLIAGLYLGVSGTPWFVLGYALTESE